MPKREGERGGLRKSRNTRVRYLVWKFRLVFWNSLPVSTLSQNKKQLLALQREVILDLLTIFIMTLRDALCDCGGVFISSNWRSWETVGGNTLSICILGRNVKHVLHFGATRLPRAVAGGDRHLKEGQGIWYMVDYTNRRSWRIQRNREEFRKTKLMSNNSLYITQSYRAL